MNKSDKIIQVKNLKKFSLTEHQSFGHNGYKSKFIYNISQNIDGKNIYFMLDYKELENYYIKIWPCNEDETERYNQLINQGHSFGAYNDDRLIGVAITEERLWNSTLWIDYIILSEEYRGMGIGELLLNELSNHAKSENFRAVTLETQNTNFPAINFYRKNGFEICGLDVALYNGANEKSEVAIFMIKNLNT